MEGSGEPNHLEGEGLSPIIELIPKGNAQIDLPEWHGLLPEHDAVERRSGRPDARSVDAHGVERFSVHDVEAAASIHQHLGEVLLADDGVDDERVAPRSSDVGRMVPLIKGDWRI